MPITRRSLLHRIVAAPFVVLVSVFLTSCKTALTTTLSLVVTAAEAAVRTLQAVGQIDSGTANMIIAYLTSVSQAVIFATQELASADSAIDKAKAILQKFAAIIQPVLPPGTAQVILAVIQSVVDAVANFLSTVQTTSVAVSRKTSKPVSMTSADLKALPGIRSRAEAVLSKLTPLRSRLVHQ